MSSADDEEWEYEYSETETEDFYIPIDLSNVPNAQIPIISQGRPGHPVLLKTRLRALNAARGQPSEIFANASNGQETTNMGEVQIVGLHTPNPLVMYNGDLLSCQWTSTIGTDMYFVKPGVNGDTEPTQPLRTLPSVDLLALGSAKLIARVGQLRPREALFDNDDDDGQPATESARVSASAPGVSTAPGQAAAGDSESVVHRRLAPTSFLAKLNDAKAKRGDASRLVVSKSSDGSRLVSETSGEDSITEHGGQSQPLDDTIMGGT